MRPISIAEVIAGIGPREQLSPGRLEAPPYTPPPEENRHRVMLAVSSMQKHTTDEGWQIALALEHAGYLLVGYGLPRNETDVGRIVRHLNPGVIVVQDKREWDAQPRDFRDRRARFNRIDCLAQDKERFKLTILKDSQQRPHYHAESAQEIGCHAWIIYYHPRIVKHLAPYIREEHCIRTYHSLDPVHVPTYRSEGRAGCFLSGAVSNAYPLRQRLFRDANRLPNCTVLHHPGYHQNGCHTPQYLEQLSRHRVAICTASRFGYALRKIIEATAAGCIVLTDLPGDEVLPEIDDNLVRIHPETPTEQIADLLSRLEASYDPQRQRHFALRATSYYDYHHLGTILARDIEALRCRYNERSQS